MGYQRQQLDIPSSHQVKSILNIQHASGAVYQVGDQFTETRYDRKAAIKRDRLSHSLAKEHDFPGNEGKSPVPRRQKNRLEDFQDTWRPSSQRSNETPTESQPHPRKSKSRRIKAQFRCSGSRLHICSESNGQTSANVSCTVEEKTGTPPHSRKSILCSTTHA